MSTQTATPLKRFQLLRGGHLDENGQYHHASDPKTNTFNTKHDLCAKFNAPGYEPKFQEITPQSPPVPIMPFEQLTEKVIRAMAVDFGVDVSKCKNKEELIKAIQETGKLK